MIEAWNTNTTPQAPLLSKNTIQQDYSKTTTQQHPARLSSKQLYKSTPSGLRRSPRLRLQQLNREKNALIGETSEKSSHELIHNKNGLQDDLFTSSGNETVETNDTMELNQSIFQELQFSEPKMEGFKNQLQAQLQNAVSNQDNPQNLRRSGRLKPVSNENVECAIDSIQSSRIRKNAARNSSVNTLVSATKCEAEAGSNVCEEEASFGKRKNIKEVECGGRILKELRRYTEPTVNLDHGNEKNTHETEVPTNKYLSKATCNKRQDKENKQNINNCIEKNITSPEVSDSNLEHVEHCRAATETRQRGVSPVSASPNIFPKIPTSMFLPSHPMALGSNSKITPEVGSTSEQCNIKTNSKTELCINSKISLNEVQNKQDDIPSNINSPENIKEKSENIVLKSPLTCQDSQSFLSTQEKMDLSAWGLPDAILKVMRDRLSLKIELQAWVKGMQI